MNPIQTDRLVIRNFVPEDWQDLQETAIRYEASEYAKYDHQWPTSEEEIKGVTEWFAGGDHFLAVCLKATGKLIGFISLPRKENGDGVVYGFGYVFNADYQGQGYATEGCGAVLDYAFGELEADRVTTGTAAANLPSCRLLEKLGMKETCRSTGSFRQNPDGTPIEFVGVSFAVSRDEWLEKTR